MTNEELLALLKEGVETWNEWRRKNPDELLDLSQASLAQNDLNLANLSLANLSLANLSLTNLSLANLTQANLRWADLSQANLRWADLTHANLSLANLTQANLSQATLNHANLRWADLSQASLIGVELIGTDLSGANLSNTDFYKANLSNIDLTGIDLNGANLTEANLSGADLSGTDLRGANLTRANLENANFTNANLTGANLVKAKAWGANFAQATFTQACIEGWEVDRHTNLEGAIFDHLTPAAPEQATSEPVTPEPVTPEAAVLEPGNPEPAVSEQATPDQTQAPELDTAAPQNNVVGLSELESRLQSHLPNVADARVPDLPQTAISQEPSFDLNFQLDQITPIDDVLAEVSFDPFAADEDDSPFFGLPDPKSLGDRDISSTTYSEEPVESLSDMDASMASRLPDLSFRFAPVPPPSPPIAPTASPIAVSTPNYLELTFSHGINWQAFLLAFQALQQQYSDRTFTIQAIAQEDDFPFVIRIKVVPLTTSSPHVEQDDLEAAAGSLYDTQLARIEAAYRTNLRLTDKQIATYRQQSIDLLGVVKQQAIRPIISVHMADEQSSQNEEQAIADALTAYEPPIVRSNDLEGWG